jgi:hypothetical protein
MEDRERYTLDGISERCISEAGISFYGVSERLPVCDGWPGTDNTMQHALLSDVVPACAVLMFM